MSPPGCYLPGYRCRPASRHVALILTQVSASMAISHRHAHTQTQSPMTSLHSRRCLSSLFCYCAFPTHSLPPDCFYFVLCHEEPLPFWVVFFVMGVPVNWAFESYHKHYFYLCQAVATSFEIFQGLGSTTQKVVHIVR